MDNINSQESVDSIIINFVSLHEIRHQTKIADEHERVPSGDPPVNSSSLRGLRVKISLDDLGRESTLLTSCLDSDIRDTEKDTVDNDEALSGRVREGQ